MSVLCPNLYLNSFQSVEDVNSVHNAASNEDMSRALSMIISEFGLSTVMGVNLLHKHFELEEGEVLLLSRTKPEERDEREIMMIMQPHKVDKLEGKIVPYQFTFQSGQWAPIAFVEERNIGNPELVAASDNCLERFSECLAQISRVLEAAGMTNRFGIMLRVYRDLQLEGGNDWSLCEITNNAARQQFWVKLSKTNPEFTNLLRTTWGSEADDKGVIKYDTCTDGCRPDGRGGHMDCHWYMP